MGVESLTYIDLADRLGTTQEAARSLVRRLRLPRHAGNDGKVRVNVDLSEIQYKRLPARSPGGHRADIDALNARIQMLQAELARLEVENSCMQASAAGHRADFERERDRSDHHGRGPSTDESRHVGPRNRRPSRGPARRIAIAFVVEKTRRLTAATEGGRRTMIRGFPKISGAAKISGPANQYTHQARRVPPGGLHAHKCFRA
jgi:hypothetical protein